MVKYYWFYSGEHILKESEYFTIQIVFVLLINPDVL